MSEKYKSIQVKAETYKELAKLGSLTDSFDSVISSLLKNQARSRVTPI
jgi:predicted CopG family antitoxin